MYSQSISSILLFLVDKSQFFTRRTSVFCLFTSLLPFSLSADWILNEQLNIDGFSYFIHRFLNNNAFIDGTVKGVRTPVYVHFLFESHYFESLPIEFNDELFFLNEQTNKQAQWYLFCHNSIALQIHNTMSIVNKKGQTYFRLTNHVIFIYSTLYRVRVLIENAGKKWLLFFGCDL